MSISPQAGDSYNKPFEWLTHDTPTRASAALFHQDGHNHISRATMASPYLKANSLSPSDTAAPSNRPASDLPQAQVDAIIRTKRKAREPKACYPCHARKVKCDRNLPCDGCVKRDHADLCSYERPSKKRSQAFHESPVGGASGSSMMEQPVPYEYDYNQASVKPEPNSELKPVPIPSRTTGASAGGRVSVARDDWDNVRNRLREMESTISSLRRGLDRAEEGPTVTLDPGSVQSADASSRPNGASPEREGLHAANTLGKGTVHLGSRSVGAYFLNSLGRDQAHALWEGGILPKLGLDNESATYPFVDLWSSDMSTFDMSAVCNALPADQQCREYVPVDPVVSLKCILTFSHRFFYFYKDIAGAIYPVLEDIPGFESNLELLLQSRNASGGVYREDTNDAQNPFGVSIAYLGLLFAVLASGSQSSDLGSKERELTSQVYGMDWNTRNRTLGD